MIKDDERRAVVTAAGSPDLHSSSSQTKNNLYLPPYESPSFGQSGSEGFGHSYTPPVYYHQSPGYYQGHHQGDSYGDHGMSDHKGDNHGSKGSIFSGLALKGILIPLAGIALLGAAAALSTNPVLLQLGILNGKRRKRSLFLSADNIYPVNPNVKPLKR